MVKLSNKRRRWLCIRLLFMRIDKRANFLKRKKIFYYFGDDVKWASKTIPAEPYLVSIGNNVRVASGVTFLTHDIISGVFSNDNMLKEKSTDKFLFYMGTIKIGDNVMIGANSTILYDVKIGSQVIVAAGSVVTKDIPDGVIVGGNPAKIIGNYYGLANRRKNVEHPIDQSPLEKIVNYYWEERKER